VWISTETNEERRFTYAELHAEVNRFAAALAEQGVGRGDRVLHLHADGPEAVFAMLATVRWARSTRSCSAGSRRRASRRGSTTHDPR
jgi:acyl-coenzyme A synthetase/AMP-(fatty) acid ligase